MKILVAGAGGFIGGHLVGKLLNEGHEIRAVDIKKSDIWFQRHQGVENLSYDLNDLKSAEIAVNGVDHVYNLACNMGGMGFISNHKADCMMSVLINTNLLLASKNAKVSRYFFASSACVYPDYRQMDSAIPGLKEEDAYPAMPEDGYGWEKLFSERLCRHYREDYGLETRIARFHNVYGPEGTFDGGREKAPAAICRKIANAIRDNETQIEIWGDGNQTRSFMYIEDCLNGIEKIMHGNFHDPINLGSSESVTINQLVEIVSKIANQKFEGKHDLTAPQGVRGRNSDNSLIKKVFDWEPSISLEIGLKETFDWIKLQIDSGNSYKYSRF